MNLHETISYMNMGLPEDILRRKLHGDFDGAIRLIDRRLARTDTPQALRYCLTAHRESLLRLPENYPYTREEAMAKLCSHVPGFTDQEFDDWVDSGKLGWIYSGGEPRYFNRFFETMCKTEPAFALRAGVRLAGGESAGSGSREEGRLDRCVRMMTEQGQMSLRIRIRASLRVKDGRFVPGMFIRAHLPIPAACEQQRDIRIEEIYPAGGQLSPEDAPRRTVCWEETMEENHEFYVVYSYTHTALYRDASQLRGDPQQPDFDTGEQPPHIVFTPYIRALVQELTRGTEDPMEKARRFYDFISLKMKYTYMPSYFALDNIAENCARSFTGDCGVFALLFITLCRCAGIPAQWQSGLVAEPEYCGGHDWARFYVAPHGWLYADPSFGTAAVRAKNEERRQFYFGNLDPYRMVANRAFQAPFTVEKEFWRADPYDNQLGEMETETRGLLYGEYDRGKELLLCEEI